MKVASRRSHLVHFIGGRRSTAKKSRSRTELEMFGERFHMDVDLLQALNPNIATTRGLGNRSV
jgi:hypothetical protein